MKVQPYLFFDGRCDEALKFYGTVFSAEVIQLLRFNEAPPQPLGAEGCLPGDGEKVMHCAFRIGDTELFASDGMNRGAPVFDGFALTVSVSDAADAGLKFDQLADGGEVVMPLEKTFFSPAFGMVKDRYGLHWQIMVPA